MTVGILLKKLQNDPMLSEYNAVMVDEAHERSLDIDFCLGLLKKTQKERSERGLNPLKIIVVSATLEKEKFINYFSDNDKKAPLLEVPGRLHEVKKFYWEGYNNMPSAAEIVKKIIDDKKDGDILIFMPGVREISITIEAIKELKLPEIVCLPLHGQISADEQKKIKEPIVGRKIIVSTNIAETSLTIPGIKHVIDSGLINQTEYDQKTGITALNTKKHSLSGLKQRAGRAGRIEAGSYYGLYFEKDLKNRPEYTKPEILRSDLSGVVLAMKDMGIDDVINFDFIDKPEKQAIKNTIEILKNLGALDGEEKLTRAGELMAQLPLEPHIARMVIEARKYHNTGIICTIAAFLGLKSVFNRPRDKESEAEKAKKRFVDKDSDFLTLLNVWDAYKLSGYSKQWARQNFLDNRTLEEVREVRFQLYQILKKNKVLVTERFDKDNINKVIFSGLVDNLLIYDGRFSYKRVKGNNSGILIRSSSVLSYNKPRTMIASHDIITNGKTLADMNMAVKSEWVKEVAPQLISKSSNGLQYDRSEDAVIEIISISLKGNGEIEQEKRVDQSIEAVKLFSEYLTSSHHGFPFIGENRETIERLNELYLKTGKAPYSTDDLNNFYFEKIKDKNIYSKKQLNLALDDDKKPLNLILNLNDLISQTEQDQINADNPDVINLNGKEYKIAYINSNGKFIAYFEVEEDIFKFLDIPRLPSGKQLNINYQGYLSSEMDLSKIKKMVKDSLVSSAWSNWVKPKVIRINDFDLLDELPVLPEKIKYASDPENNSDIFAYPAINYYSGEYQIKYFPNQDEAYQSEDTVLSKMKIAKISHSQEIEKNLIAKPAIELLNKIKDEASLISSYYTDYNLSYDEKRELDAGLYSAKNNISSNPKETIRIIEGILPIIEKARQFAEEKKYEEEKIDDFINKNLKASCPFCGANLAEGFCNNDHDLELLDFEFNKYSNESSAVLKQIVINYKDGSEELVAETRVSGGGDNFESGDVYLCQGSGLTHNYSRDYIYSGYHGKKIKELSSRDINILSNPEERRRAKRVSTEEIKKKKAEADDADMAAALERLKSFGAGSIQQKKRK